MQPGDDSLATQHPHTVTGAGSRSHCLPLMSMSLMEMEESEGHISIQIASILSAIHPAGSACCIFPSASSSYTFFFLNNRFIPIAYISFPCCSWCLPIPCLTNLFRLDLARSKEIWVLVYCKGLVSKCILFAAKKMHTAAPVTHFLCLLNPAPPLGRWWPLWLPVSPISDRAG